MELVKGILVQGHLMVSPWKTLCLVVRAHDLKRGRKESILNAATDLLAEFRHIEMETFPGFPNCQLDLTRLAYVGKMF